MAPAGLCGADLPPCLAVSRRGCFTALGAWLRKRFDLSHSQCYGAEGSASQIGSGVVVPLFTALARRHRAVRREGRYVGFFERLIGISGQSQNAYRRHG
jgi:hypothetical protein